MQERWHEIRCPFSQLSSYSADTEGDESKAKGEWDPYYFGVEAADDTLMNLDHRCSPTQSYEHTSTHTIYATRLIALLLFSATNLCCHFQSVHIHGRACAHMHTPSPDVLSSSLLWAELSHSHRHQPLSKGSWSWEKYGLDENGKKACGNLCLDDSWWSCCDVSCFVQNTLSASYAKENHGHKVQEWTDIMIMVIRVAFTNYILQSYSGIHYVYVSAATSLKPVIYDFIIIKP